MDDQLQDKDEYDLNEHKITTAYSSTLQKNGTTPHNATLLSSISYRLDLPRHQATWTGAESSVVVP